MEMLIHQLLIPSLQTGVKWRSWDNHSKSIFYRLGGDNPFAIKRKNMCRYQWVSTHGGREMFLPSRQRRLNLARDARSPGSSTVADATREYSSTIPWVDGL